MMNYNSSWATLYKGYSIQGAYIDNGENIKIYSLKKGLIKDNLKSLHQAKIFITNRIKAHLKVADNN